MDETFNDLPETAKRFFKMLPYLLEPGNDLASDFRKRVGLLKCGLSKEEVDMICEPPKTDRKKMMDEVAKACLKEQRAMVKLHRELNPEPVPYQTALDWDEGFYQDRYGPMLRDREQQLKQSRNAKISESLS